VTGSNVKFILTETPAKVLVLGGTGFIGNELTRELAARGHDVTVLARTPSDDASNEFRTVNGDVTDYDSIEEPSRVRTPW